MIEKQKQLKAQQDDRIIRFTMGKTVAMTAAKGLELSGSPMAVMADTMTQLEMDKAISQYNFEMQKYGALSQAESTERRGATLSGQYRRSGDTAVMAGISGGLSTLFQTGAYVSQRNYISSSPVKTKINTSGRSGYGSGASAYNTLGVV
jgi:hypothetical protein